MVLVVWGNRTRLLFTSAEKMPACWKTWYDTIGAAVRRKWGDWQVPSVGDSTRVHFGLAPSKTCTRNTRAPVAESSRRVGISEPWWVGGGGGEMGPMFPYD